MISDLQLNEAAEDLRNGRLVVIPTETVYGLGANALDATAVAKIFELKQRPHFDPLIVHISDQADLKTLVRHVPEKIQQLMDQFWPGPLSVVLEKLPIVPDLVTSGLDSVAIRCPGHQTARSLIRLAGCPIAAPSANRFGAISPTTADHVREQFGHQSPKILDAGACEIGVESTVVGYHQDEVVMLRPGGITRESMETLIGEVRIAGTDNESPSSPGQLTKHYAPRTPLKLVEHGRPIASDTKVGLLTLSPESEAEDLRGFQAVEYLSRDGCYRQAAANLFAAMRRLDALGLDQIVARPVGNQGLGLAINDRLSRAAAKS